MEPEFHHYVSVTPIEHDETCHRGQNTTRPGGLDTEHCERCRNLWARISPRNPDHKMCPL